ncbi:uncharacterized protein LOC141535172 [Cotesia typhae]|uniref:uncharacterized protein LOC141535172 n=1 Tax=Cotesia typhae TaxID=2053667 RepID=UPI003D68FB2C
MYAYIKLISSGKFTTVAINQIKKYKKSNPNKIFQVKIQGKYYQCLVGATHESQEELADIIKNGERVRFPPAALLSDLSETDDQTRCRKKSTGASQDNNTRDLLNKKLSAINKDRFNTEERSVIASSNLKQRETTESEVKKDKPQKRKKSNDSGIQSLDGLNKENEFVDSKKMKKEPGLRKQKNIITRKNEVLSTAVILVRPTDNKLVKESEEETDKNVTIPVSPSSEGLFSSPPHHCHGSQFPITEQKQLSTTIERPSTSNMGSNDFKDKMEKVLDIEPKTIVVTPGKDKKRKNIMLRKKS